MSRYLLSVHMAAGQVREPMSEEDMRRGFEKIDGLEREMRAANALVFSGRLGEPSEARVVRPSNGRVRAIDGPYAETKEQLGGFYIIEAGDLECRRGMGLEGQPRDRHADRGAAVRRYALSRQRSRRRAGSVARPVSRRTSLPGPAIIRAAAIAASSTRAARKGPYRWPNPKADAWARARRPTTARELAGSRTRPCRGDRVGRRGGPRRRGRPACREGGPRDRGGRPAQPGRRPARRACRAGNGRRRQRPERHGRAGAVPGRHRGERGRERPRPTPRMPSRRRRARVSRRSPAEPAHASRVHLHDLQARPPLPAGPDGPRGHLDLVLPGRQDRRHRAERGREVQPAPDHGRARRRVRRRGPADAGLHGRLPEPGAAARSRPRTSRAT